VEPAKTNGKAPVESGHMANVLAGGSSCTETATDTEADEELNDFFDGL